MKVSNKILIYTVLAMSVSFSIAGFILLNSFFQSGYQQSVDNAIDANRMILYSLSSYMSNEVTSVEEITQEDIQDGMNMVAEMLKGENEKIRVYMEDGTKIFANINVVEPKDEEIAVDASKMAYFRVKDGDKEYIEVMSQMSLGEHTIRVCTYRDISSLYETRRRQFSIYNRVMAALIVIYGAISFLISRIIVRPLNRISRTAQRIADGNLEYRIKLQGSDEFEDMAYNFNKMADTLAGKIEELEESSKRQEEFVGNFTHELKTPLTSIIGYADLMRSDETISELNLMCATYIFQEGKRLESLSLRLLELIVMKKEALHLKPVSITKLFREINATLLPLMTKELIAFKVKAQEQKIMMEPELMKTVIMNVVDNARKAINENGRILLSGHLEGDNYIITVVDNGKGIPKDQIDKITNAFYMVDKSRSRKQGGAGLGLAICAEIIRLHKGNITFASKEGEGTKVTLVLKAGEWNEE